MPEKEKTRNSISDADRFWDIDLMLPRRRMPSHASADTDTVEITSTYGNESSEDSGIEKIPDEKMIDRIPQSVLYEERKNARMDAARKVLEGIEKKHLMMRTVSEGDRKYISEKIDDPHLDDSSDKAVTELETYRPEGNTLLCEVSVSKWPSRYTFYHKFRTDAAKYYRVGGKKCRSVPYFSFTPQYDQLDSAQLEWYFWWRENARNGNYLTCDYSYILMYIYEIINLPDILPPQHGIKQLCGIWTAYRETHPKLDKYLSEWVCDYCLIHRIAFPAKEFGKIIPDIIRCTSFKEFYIGYGDDSGHTFASAFYSFGSGHDWRNGKYVTDETHDLFEKHIKGAFIYAFSKLDDADEKIQSRILNSGKAMALTKVSRDAYSGALCAYDVKRRIDISYYSCTKSVELRYAATDLIKYAENNVRSMLSIKSRYHITQLDMYLKRAVDEYFAPYKVKKPRRKAEAPVPEYEKNYERVSEELSPGAAARIEEQAWDTAKLLIDAFDGEENEAADASSGMTIKEQDSAEEIAGTKEYIPQITAFSCDGEEEPSPDSEAAMTVRSGLKAVLGKNMQEIHDISKSNNILPDTLIELLNEACCDIVGDIAVEEDGENGWRIISDYKEELEEWLNR